MKKIAMPGAVTVSGARRMKFRFSLSIAPHSGSPISAPRPRKLRPAASKMAAPIPSVACTINGAMQFGKTVRVKIRKSLAPMTLAAMT